ncbi:MAG: anthranilate phosphoribosyltransferase [Balneolaceae bacterium]|nr:anthranilate phosphoribosyltransferase [Balneolaceae bacterium]MDR9446192.1 anthranilate phosphoribosyltransferase [Balneolaceae bacterium]
MSHSSIERWVAEFVASKELRDHELDGHRECFAQLIRGSLAKDVAEDYLRTLASFPLNEAILSMAVDVVRGHMVPFQVDESLTTVDVCGTGGDGQNTFNISTTTFFVLAGAGYHVVKHGNRGVTSSSGSSDVLQELGIPVVASVNTLHTIFEEIGSVFLFAPSFHPVLKHVAPIRASLGIRTIFNVMGPLLNPANPTHQLVGAYGVQVAQTMAESLHQRGVEATVFHHLEGYDEWVPFGQGVSYRTAPMQDHVITSQRSYHDFHVHQASQDDVRGGSIQENAQILRQILQNEADAPKIDTVCMNAAMAIHTISPERPLREAMEQARDSIASGAALNVLESMIEVSHVDS